MTREEIEIKVHEIHEKYDYRCQFPGCNKRSEQIAHRISQGKGNKAMIKKRLIYLCLDKQIKPEDILHHEFNVTASCSEHNSSFNVAMRPIEVSRLLTAIIKDLTKYRGEKSE